MFVVEDISTIGSKKFWRYNSAKMLLNQLLPKEERFFEGSAPF